MSNEHPAVTAAAKHAEYVRLTTESKEQRMRAASLRREAKTAALKVDAYAMRLDAKASSNKAFELRTSAKAAKAEVIAQIGKAAALLVGRLPPEYVQWGVIKTRAYVKVLGVVVAQSKRDAPNLALTTHAMSLLLAHGSWSDDVMSRLSIITSMPKELPR